MSAFTPERVAELAQYFKSRLTVTHGRDPAAAEFRDTLAALRAYRETLQPQPMPEEKRKGDTMSDLVQRLQTHAELIVGNSCAECGNSAGLGLEAADEIERQAQEIAQLRADAERYRWLREQHWSDSTLCVVGRPRDSVKLGSDCPSESLLDAAIDAQRAGENA